MTTENKIETVTCSRCGGTGNYSFCYSHGTRCFKCNGKGQHATKRGAMASKYLTSLRSKPASDIKVGDIVRSDWGCPVTSTHLAFGTVTNVEKSDAYPADFSSVNGVIVKTESTQLAITIVHPEHGSMTTHISPATMFRVKQTDEQIAETFQKAMEYQATLTKTGLPRKR